MLASLEEIAEKIRQQSRLILVDDYELAFEKSRRKEWQYHNGDLTLHQERESLWIGLRIFHRRSPGYAVSAVGPAFSVENLLDLAFASAKNSSPDPWFRFPIWREIKSAPFQEPGWIAPQSQFSELNTKDLFLSENYQTEVQEVFLTRKRERVRFQHKKGIHRAAFRVLNKDRDGAFSLSERRARLESIDTIKSRLSLLIDQSKEQRGAAPASFVGPANLLIGPSGMSVILNELAPVFYADRVQSKLEKWGVSEAITLIDEGNHPTAASSCPFDMEGNPTQKTILLDKGVFNSLLFDTRSATKENRLSTGNLRKIPENLTPRISHSCLYIAPSIQSVKELLGHLERGFVLDSIESIECDNPSTFSYKIGGRGWFSVSNSQFTPAKGISFKVQLLDLLSHAIAVANDFELYENCGSPSILFENVPLV